MGDKISLWYIYLRLERKPRLELSTTPHAANKTENWNRLFGRTTTHFFLFFFGSSCSHEELTDYALASFNSARLSKITRTDKRVENAVTGTPPPASEFNGKSQVGTTGKQLGVTAEPVTTSSGDSRARVECCVCREFRAGCWKQEGNL